MSETIQELMENQNEEDDEEDESYEEDEVDEEDESDTVVGTIQKRSGNITLFEWSDHMVTPQ